jgi:hypothetical protein
MKLMNDARNLRSTFPLACAHCAWQWASAQRLGIREARALKVHFGGQLVLNDVDMRIKAVPLIGQSQLCLRTDSLLAVHLTPEDCEFRGAAKKVTSCRHHLISDEQIGLARSDCGLVQ